MRRITTSSALLLAGMSALAMGAAQNAGATTLINDQFSGTSGTNLSGNQPDTTNLAGNTWVQYGTTSNNGGNPITPNSTDAITYGGSNSAAFPLYSGSGAYAEIGAAINFNADTSPTGGLLTVSGTLDALNNGSEWLALGIGPSNPTNNYGPWTGGPWVLVKHTGEVQFFATGGTGHLVVDDTTAENTTGTHSIQISYNPTTTTASLSVDGTAVTGGTYTYGGTNAAAPASFGSVFIDNRYKFAYSPVAGASNYGTFGNVVVTGTPTPEPMTLAIFAAGAMGLSLLRRKRAS